MAKVSKNTTSTSIKFIKKTRKSGVSAKTKTSKTPSSDLYKKPYGGQGR